MCKCEVGDCDLEKYKDHNECVLHCEKEIGFQDKDMDSDFFEKLESYIRENLMTLSNEVTFKKICFPSLKTEHVNIVTDGIHRIKFEGCYFYDTDLDNIIKFAGNILKVNFEDCKVNFEDCYFYGTDLRLSKKVVFNKCQFLDFFNFFTHNVSELRSTYCDCIFKENVDCGWNDVYDELIKTPYNIKECHFEKGVIIKNKVIKENIFIIKCDATLGSKVRFEGCTFDKNAKIDNKFEYMKSAINGEQNKNKLIFSLADQVSFENCNFQDEQEFYISDNKEIDFSFDKCNFDKKFKIRGVEKGGYEEQQKNKGKLKELKIMDCTVGESAYLRIGFLVVDDFVLSNLRLPQNAELNIGDCHFQRFKLTNFRNAGKFKLYKINILPKEYNKEGSYNPKFQIDNTSIGKTDFQSVNLTSFASVVMFDNIFTEIDYTNVQWKREIEVRQYGMENGQLRSADIKKRIKNDKVSVCEIVYDRSNSDTEIAKYKMSNSNSDTEIAKKRDTYRTLKNVMIRNNDQREALIFYQKEMEKHWQITKWKKEFGNKVILAVNKYTNNFGLNWWLPIVWLFGFSVVFYCLLLFNLKMPIFALENWQEYFKFLIPIPIHKTEFIAEGCWGFWSYMINFVFRIIEGLFIYQTIQAVRKYSRKL